MSELLTIFAGAFLGSSITSLVWNWWEDRRYDGVMLALSAPKPITSIAAPTRAEIAAGCTEGAGQ